MADELRNKAYQLLIEVQRSRNQLCEMPPLEKRMGAFLKTLLAERPKDDDQPADPEWCLANGAEAEDDGGDTIYVWHHRKLSSNGTQRDYWSVIINDLGELWLEVSFYRCGSVMISAEPTRRQVRDLLRVLNGGE